MQSKRKRKSCGVYIAERSAANRDRQVEQLFSQMERDARREQLIGTDAAQREKEKHEAARQIQPVITSR